MTGRCWLKCSPSRRRAWHRALVACKYTLARRLSGRSSTEPSVESLFLWMARGNPSWGHRRTKESWPGSGTRSRIRACGRSCTLPILNEAHLRAVLTEYAAYYNAARPHQAPPASSRTVRPSSNCSSKHCDPAPRASPAASWTCWPPTLRCEPASPGLAELDVFDARSGGLGEGAVDRSLETRGARSEMRWKRRLPPLVKSGGVRGISSGLRRSLLRTGLVGFPNCAMSRIRQQAA